MSGYDTGMDDTDLEEQAYQEGRAEQKRRDDAEIARLRDERDEALGRVREWRHTYEVATGFPCSFDGLHKLAGKEVAADLARSVRALAARVEALEGALRNVRLVMVQDSMGQWDADRIYRMLSRIDALLSREPAEPRPEGEQA